MAVSPDAVMNIAVIGTGEMGSAVGQRLRETGARVMTELNGRSEQSAERAKDAGLEIINGDELLVEQANLILSIVPPAVACAVADRFRGPLAKTAHKPTFVECNAISPATVRRIEASLTETGCSFVDSGIIGGPPLAGDLTKGPRFYASGPHAHKFASLTRFGLDIVVLDAQIGAASALKLAYAGLTKGFTALGAAMVGAAARDNLDGALRAELARSQPEMLKRLYRFIPAMFPKAHRWVAEMEQIADFAGEESAGATMYKGAAQLYERIAAAFENEQGTEWLSALTSFCSPSDE